MRNSFERGVGAQLRRAKVKYEYERTRLPYTISAIYIPDFTLPGPIYIETKGWFRPEDKRKMRAVKAAHPEKDIRIVFQGRSLKNIKWAEKNGFPWAIGSIPKEWLR